MTRPSASSRSSMASAPGEGGPVEGLGGDAGVLLDGDQIQSVQFGVADDLGPLGVERHAFARLFLGADPDVPHRSHDLIPLRRSRRTEIISQLTALSIDP